jgi:hypothetical protein
MAQTRARQGSGGSRSGGQSRNGSRPRSRSTVERLRARASEATDGLGPIAQKSAKPAIDLASERSASSASWPRPAGAARRPRSFFRGSHDGPSNDEEGR